VTITDPWHWLRDPKYPEVTDPDVLAYLHAENDYFEGWKKQHQGLIDRLFEEMKGRIKEDESSVPIRDGDFLYWWAFRPGAQYRTWYRRRAAAPFVSSEIETPPSTALGTNGHEAEGEIIFDEPVEAEGKEYFRLGAIEVSPDGKLLATLATSH
jgi:oligopeptidase B